MGMAGVWRTKITLRTLWKALVLGLLGLLSMVAPLGFAAGHSTASFQFLVGAGAICNLPVPNPCPDVSMASNGDTVTVAGQGTLSIFPKSVTGSGTFVHKAPDGTVQAMGTWTAIQLMSFRSFGNSSGLPSSFVGGQAIMLVQLSVGGKPVHTAVLTVICEVGAPPDGLHEGFKLAVQDTPFNFNKQVSGITLFIIQA
jgi:hypothetical protein